MEHIKNTAFELDTRESADERLIGLAELFGIIWARKLVIAGCGFAVLALAIGYLIVAPRTYTADASLLIEPRFSGVTEADNVLAGIGADSAAVESQVKVISSTELLERVFRSENIFSDPEFSKPGMLGSVLSLVFGGDNAPNEIKTFERMRKKLDVERAGLTYVIDVRFSSKTPGKAARIANAVAGEYLTSLKADKTAANNEVSSLLENPIEELRQSVVNAEMAIEDFKKKNGILGLDGGRTLDRAEIELRNQRLLEAQERTNLAKDRYLQAVAAGTSVRALNSAQNPLNSRTMEGLRLAFSQASTRLASLQTTYGPGHPLYASAASEVSQLGVQMQAEANRIIAQLKDAQEIEQSNLRIAQAELGRLRDQIELSDQREVQLRQLESKAEASRQVLERFVQRSKETSELQKVQRPEAKIINTAIPPIRAAWPRPSIVLPVALMLGLAVGGMIALGLGFPAERGRRRKLATTGMPDVAVIR